MINHDRTTRPTNRRTTRPAIRRRATSRPARRSTRPRLALGLLALGLLALVLPWAPRASGDDVDLLRFDSAKPYLFIVLDTSTSMNLDLDNNPVHADGDDPRSKIYQAKEVLYEVLSEISGVQLGFVSYNQDQLAVTGKHYLYYVADTESNRNAVASLPIEYPLVEPDDEVETVSGGDITVDIDGDMLTFGPIFRDGAGTAIEAGTCSNPLSLDREREKINRFSKLGVDSNTSTVIWIEGGSGNKTYRLTWQNPAAADKLGRESFNVRLVIQQLSNGNGACSGPSFSQTDTILLELELWRPFVMWDDSTNSVFLVPEQTQSKNREDTGGDWDWRDVTGNFRCGDDKPFSGDGWDGNYDTGDPTPPDADIDAVAVSQIVNADMVCDDRSDDTTCQNLKLASSWDDGLLRDNSLAVSFSNTYRELDVGDMVPYHWTKDYRNKVLARLNPKHDAGERDFGVAGYFLDSADPDLGQLKLAESDELPIIAAGNSPLSDTVIDFRCWYTSVNDNKCKNDDLEFETGFQALAAANDTEWNCRKPYLLFITDGENNCTGENPTADVAGLFSAASIRSWVVNLGTSNQGEINSIVQPGKGEVVTVETKNDLRDELRRILGLIEEESRAFASAAVPTVQADIADSIYISQFTPLDGKAHWDGHILGFRKPLPIEMATGEPLIEAAVWDAGVVMSGSSQLEREAGTDNPDTTDVLVWREVDSNGNITELDRDLIERQAPTVAEVNAAFTDSGLTGVTRAVLKVGEEVDERRVYYPMSADGDRVPRRRVYLAPLTTGDVPTGLGVVDVVLDLVSEFENVSNYTDLRRLYANYYALELRAPKNADGTAVTDPSGTQIEVPYILGDVFHSNPQVIGGPNNVRFFADDLYGYRAFSDQQMRRRKVLLVGANDGLLHGFDVGVFRGRVEGGVFDDGTGRELFAVAPRATLPSIEKIAESVTPADAGDFITGTSNADHQWGIDGTPTVADVYIDPVHTGTPDPDDREWRTVAVSGLRRGGRAVFAVDITDPDTMIKDIDDETNVVLGYIPQGSDSGRLDLPDKQSTYPSILWEIADPDLGETWSNPNIGAIKVIEGGSEVIKFVAVFGGGRDPDNLSTGGLGQAIYMVDIETGKVIYERPVVGSVAADTAAVDTNQDGYLDRIYVATMGGFVYRVDIETPVPLVDDGVNPPTINAAAWNPYKIFDTIDKDTGIRKPIFFAPSVVFISQIGSYALAFGTGNRDELWSISPTGGDRFYVFVDDSARLDAASLPMTEATLTELPGTFVSGDLLTGSSLYGARGWYLMLDEAANEKVVTPASAISGILVFSTFLPEIEEEDDADAPGTKLCAKRGDSRNYVVFTTNGNGVLTDDLGVESRFEVVSDAFVTEPFIEQGQTRNLDGSDAQPLDDRMLGVMEALKELYPPNCRFAEGYRFDIKTVRSDTGMVHIAPLPVCIRETNWKEF